MPKTITGLPWEQGFRASIRTSPGLDGFTVSNANNRGRIGVRWRPTDGRKPQSVVLDLAWSQDSTAKAIQLLSRAAKVIAEGKTDNLKTAVAMAQDGSTTMRRDLVWQEVVDSLRDVLMNHRNEILATTWKDNYQPYVTEALRLIDAGQA